MNITVLSTDRFYADSLVRLSAQNAATDRTLFVLDLMHIDNYADALASVIVGENHTLALVVNHVNHLDFIEPVLLRRLSKAINIAVISRKAQRFEYEALLANPHCHIKHGSYSENPFSSAQRAFIAAMAAGLPCSPAREVMSDKSLSAHKRKLMKTRYITSNAELYAVLMKHKALGEALCEAF